MPTANNKNVTFLRRYLKAILDQPLPNSAQADVTFNREFIKKYQVKYPNKGRNAYTQLEAARKNIIRIIKRGQLPLWIKENNDLLNLCNQVHRQIKPLRITLKTEPQDEMDFVPNELDNGNELQVVEIDCTPEMPHSELALYEQNQKQRQELEAAFFKIRQLQDDLEASNKKQKEAENGLLVLKKISEIEIKKYQSVAKEFDDLKKYQSNLVNTTIHPLQLENQKLQLTKIHLERQIQLALEISEEKTDKIRILNNNNATLITQLNYQMMHPRQHIHPAHMMPSPVHGQLPVFQTPMPNLTRRKSQQLSSSAGRNPVQPGFQRAGTPTSRINIFPAEIFSLQEPIEQMTVPETPIRVEIEQSHLISVKQEN